METKDLLTEKIIGCCYRVHSELGPGFSERIYHKALVMVLKESGLDYETEKQYDVYFNEKKLGYLKLDLVVERKVIVEIKALTHVLEVYKYQILSYLKVSGLSVGLLINFGDKSCSIKRFVHQSV